MATAAVLPNTLSNNLSHLSEDFKSSLDNYLQYSKGCALLNDRYSFVRNLQTGSFGKVTCALDTVTNEKVAIKALKKSIKGIDLMANHETSIMKSLGYHKNITQLLDYFETKKYFIMVLEFADSGDLYDAIHNKTTLGLGLQTSHVLFSKFCAQLSDVIAYSHSKGVYHRDIKPENILLMSDGTIKLCDWGLATKNLVSKDFNVGTEKYMAPEALIKSDENSNYNSMKIDFYSVGITLLFTLFNKCPFRKALQSDPNYSNFLKSKYFIYDFFTSINLISFTGIVEMLILNRDPKGLNYLIENGLKNGYTIDQEHSISFSNQQNNYINSIINSFNSDLKVDVNNNYAANLGNDQNNTNDMAENGDVFLFDDFETLNEDDFINDNIFNESNDYYDNGNNDNNQIDNSNVNPISIPLPPQQVNCSNIAGSIINSTSTYNSNSLFDSNSNLNQHDNHNSFINSFELSNSNDVWSHQISDLRFKFP